ncbi:18552_t:CDS:2, partial [Gigaspora rosea]
FKQTTLKRKKKIQVKKYQLYQKKHQTNSESEQIDSELNQLISTCQQLLEELFILKSSCYQPKSPSDINDSETNLTSIQPTNFKDYISVIKFIQNKQLNPQDFYSKFNELDSNNMVHDYEYPLNGGIC